jgi:hypothetical protein
VSASAKGAEQVGMGKGLYFSRGSVSIQHSVQLRLLLCLDLMP